MSHQNKMLKITISIFDLILDAMKLPFAQWIFGIIFALHCLESIEMFTPLPVFNETDENGITIRTYALSGEMVDCIYAILSCALFVGIIRSIVDEPS